MKNNIVLVFPGQGSQYVGMARDFLTEFQLADQVLGYPLLAMALDGPNDLLKSTENTQPAILTHSIGMFNKLKVYLDQKQLKIKTVLGHSVGEYSALVAAGALDFTDAVQAVHLRGKYMQEAVPEGEGTMYAILKVPENIILKACELASTENSQVMPANYNEPTQIVISGHKAACERAVQWLTENYKEKFRAIELNVSAPFHSGLMKAAEKKLAVHLNQISIKSLKFPYIANVDAKIYGTNTNADTIINNLNLQVCGSVLWTQSIQQVTDDSLFIEVGPGAVLSGLIKKIKPQAKIVTLDTPNAFELLGAALGE